MFFIIPVFLQAVYLTYLHRSYPAIVREVRPEFSGQIGQALEYAPEIESFLRRSHESSAQDIESILGPLEKIGALLSDIDVIGTDIQNAVEAVQNMPKIMSCNKASNEALRGNSPNAAICRSLGCLDHTSCIKRGISEMKMILKPFINDIFLGYVSQGVIKQGIVFDALDIINEPQLKHELISVINVLEQILHFIDIVDDMIVAGDV
ncbi:MAG: hypothetical protein WC707_03535 [Candidatus Babeliaceae bacterium]